MQRRSTHMAGCVAFPVNDPCWPTTGEGGMFVKLVVVNNAGPNGADDVAVCCGAQVFDVLVEVLVGDDKRPKPVLGVSTTVEEILAEVQQRDDWQAYHFPQLADARAPGTGACIDPYLSRDYMASIVMGSTGWSGCNADGDYWTCTVDDLTDEGKALYQQMAALYPGATLHLLTFLDT